MALATINGSFKRTGQGELFIAEYPTVSPGATTALADMAKGYFELWYADGDARKTLDTGILPWGKLTADGLSLKFKQNLVEQDYNMGPKEVVGIKDLEVDGEFTFTDVDFNHLKDVFGMTSAEQLAGTIAAASGKAGRKGGFFGGNNVLKNYSVMYRMPSQKVAGQFDHYVFMKTSINIDSDFKLNKNNCLSFKVKIQAYSDEYTVNSDTGMYEIGFVDFADAAPTA